MPLGDMHCLWLFAEVAVIHDECPLGIALETTKLVFAATSIPRKGKVKHFGATAKPHPYMLTSFSVLCFSCQDQEYNWNLFSFIFPFFSIFSFLKE